ncbi:MAG: ATP-binding protein, partial [Deltaproteobacteria bacterium]|nr:ATP-binding protein [Deltaproteobacteria bacterium]
MFIDEISRKLHDFYELGLPPLVEREGVLHHAERTVSTLIGARRAGKSFRACQWGHECLAKKTIKSPRHICFVDFDNPILSQMQAKDLNLIQDTFLKINPDCGLKTRLLFIFDEIHKISGWENYVISLSQNPYWQVMVTGSSSKLLRENIATELRGKAISTNIYPLSFREFLKFHNVDPKNRSTKACAAIQRLFDAYLNTGSYPALALLNEHSKTAMLREYFDTMILKDIIQRHDVSRPSHCLMLYHYLLSLMGKNHTIQSAYDFLKQQGLPTSKKAVKDYIAWAEDAWFLFTTPLFSDSRKEQERNYKKIYCIDWALAMQNSSVWDGSLSHALENMVYLHLARRYPRVNYYLTRQKRQEVDFIITGQRGKPEMAVQACLKIDAPSTLKREIEPLTSTAAYFKIKNNFVVTLYHEESITENGVRIHIIPAWRWLL